MAQSGLSASFAAKVVVVTGAASGIGAALTDRLVAADAEVHALDIAEVTAAVTEVHQCDLGEQASIDRALIRLPASIDMLFNCAGVPNGGRFGAAEVMAINWLGLRHLSESVLERIPAGGSITHVASTAGRLWAVRIDELTELLSVDSFVEGAEWVANHADVVGDGYAFSKEAVQYYTMMRALEIRPQHDVRMNSICPGITNTAIAEDFRRGVGDAVIERAKQIAGRLAEPDEMAPALMFLAHHETASYINGVNLNVDRGTGAAHEIGSW